MTDDLTLSQQAAAFHGLATNGTVPPQERLSCAIQALDPYEAAVEAERQTLTETEASHQAEIARLREDFSARRLQLMNHIADGEADRDVLAARLAAAETVVDAAQAWRPFAPMPRTRATAELIAAVDAYRATPGTTETAT